MPSMVLIFRMVVLTVCLKTLDVNSFHFPDDDLRLDFTVLNVFIKYLALHSNFTENTNHTIMLQQYR